MSVLHQNSEGIGKSIPIRPRDFPRPSRFSGNLSGVGDGFSNTSLVLEEHRYHADCILCGFTCSSVHIKSQKSQFTIGWSGSPTGQPAGCTVQCTLCMFSMLWILWMLCRTSVAVCKLKVQCAAETSPSGSSAAFRPGHKRQLLQIPLAAVQCSAAAALSSSY